MKEFKIRKEVNNEITKEIDENTSEVKSSSGKELNQKGYRTVTNKVWNKSNLSLYIKRMGIGVGK